MLRVRKMRLSMMDEVERAMEAAPWTYSISATAAMVLVAALIAKHGEAALKSGEKGPEAHTFLLEISCCARYFSLFHSGGRRAEILLLSSSPSQGL